jgi:hypothetical protein
VINNKELGEMLMAFEKIIEFDKDNRFKVKLEVGNIDTSTVCEVEIDNDIANIERSDDNSFSFNVREFYIGEGVVENEAGQYEDWSCKYNVDRVWSLDLEYGELSVWNTEDKNELRFTESNFPDGMDSLDFDLDLEGFYDVYVTYEKIESEKEGVGLMTLNCRDMDGGTNYGTGIDVPDVELSDTDLEKLADWYVKYYGNGSVTVEGVKNHEYDNEIKEIIEQAILDNATVYDEKAGKYYNQTVKSYYVAYSAKVNCSFELNGMAFNINYDEIERHFPLNRGLEDYSKVLELVEKDELDNLFSDSDKDELEQLKIQIKDNYYSVASIPVEVDWEMCKGYAKEAGVADEYLTEVNLKRALEIALEDVASEYSRGDCFVRVKDNLIYAGTDIKEYEDIAEEDIETIGKLSLEEDYMGVVRLYVSGEMQDELGKASDYKEVITRIWSYVTWFKQEKVKADTYIQEINTKIKNILPSVMERILTVAEVDKDKEWLNKKLGLAKELEQAVATYLSAKRGVWNALEDDSLKKLNIDTTGVGLLCLDVLKGGSLRIGVESLTSVLGDLKEAKTSFSMLQEAEIKFEEILKMESGSCSLVLEEIRSQLNKLLNEHNDNEKMVQEIEEALALTKQPKVITAEEEMVSAWNKYIGLKMEK